MKCYEIVEIAKGMGFVVEHYLILKDKKSGVVMSGKFTKYKQHETNGLRLKGADFEIEVITNGESNFDILKSVPLIKVPAPVEEFVGKETTINFGRDLRMSQPWRGMPDDIVLTILRKTKGGQYILRTKEGVELPALSKTNIDYFII